MEKQQRPTVKTRLAQLEKEHQALLGLVQRVCDQQAKIADRLTHCEKHIGILQPALLKAIERIGDAEQVIKELVTSPVVVEVKDAPTNTPPKAMGRFEVDQERWQRVLTAVQLLTGKADPDLVGGAYTPEQIEEAAKMVDEMWPKEGDIKEDPK